jgi:hypothetical protein
MKRKWVRKEITKIEKRYRISFDVSILVSSVIVKLMLCVGCLLQLPIVKNILVLHPDVNKRSFREVIFHELGHVFVRKYGVEVPKSFNRCSTHNEHYFDYLMNGPKLAASKRLVGFVSGYARTTREEDFCETFACYLLNEKTHGRMRFGGEVFDVKPGSRLAKKFAYVKKTLREKRAQ